MSNELKLLCGVLDGHCENTNLVNIELSSSVIPSLRITQSSEDGEVLKDIRIVQAKKRLPIRFEDDINFISLDKTSHLKYAVTYLSNISMSVLLELNSDPAIEDQPPYDMTAVAVGRENDKAIVKEILNTCVEPLTTDIKDSNVQFIRFGVNSIMTVYVAYSIIDDNTVQVHYIPELMLTLPLSNEQNTDICDVIRTLTNCENLVFDSGIRSLELWSCAYVGNYSAIKR